MHNQTNANITIFNSFEYFKYIATLITIFNVFILMQASKQATTTTTISERKQAIPGAPNTWPADFLAELTR